jgi:methylamine dehydrogenase heavy chain
MPHHSLRRALLLLLPALLAAGAARAQLAVETITMEPMKAADSHRIYLSDPTMPHLVDGRIHVIDGTSMRYLGMIGAGFAGFSVLSPDRKTLFVSTTYMSRLQRGTRTDVMEAYDTGDLMLRYEIELPPRRAQGLAIKALTAVTADSRFLLIQNATPATSVTVIDLQQRRVTSEPANPGCWGVIPWPSPANRFSSICGDGTIATFELDPDGKAGSPTISKRFFDPDKDPVFMHYEMLGDELVMVSYHGAVYTVQLAGAAPTPREPWSFIDAAAKKQRWAPGGMALFALDPDTRRLYVGMHDQQAEGSHKTPAKQLWVIDLAAKKRVARLPGDMALSMAMTRDKPRRLYLLNAENRLVSIDPAAPDAKRRKRSDPVGETPVYLELH